MSSQQPGETSDGKPAADGDVESDPAKDAETGSEWADEGGAIDDGPATDPEAS